MKENREILDTKNMLEDGFFARLGNIKVSPKKVKEMQESIDMEESENSRVNTRGKREEVSYNTGVNYNTEKILMDLFEARDMLIDSFSKIGITNQSQSMVEGINKIGSCISSMGGEVEKFDPFSHISGLQAPNLKKSAKRVIENTVESYTLGKIENIDIEDDGKTIVLSFIGKQGNVDYKAVGTLTALKKWNGNEAIDYVYTPSEGRMSVKEYDNGKWIDKSASYKISWELFEKEADFNVMPTEVENTQEIIREVKEAKEAETNEEVEYVEIEEGINEDAEELIEEPIRKECKKIKEEIKNNALNNIDSDEDNDEEIGDFPIEEK